MGPCLCDEWWVVAVAGVSWRMLMLGCQSVCGSLTGSSTRQQAGRTVCVTASERPTTAFNRCIDPEFVAWQGSYYCLQFLNSLSQPSSRHLAEKDGNYTEN